MQNYVCKVFNALIIVYIIISKCRKAKASKELIVEAQYFGLKDPEINYDQVKGIKCLREEKAIEVRIMLHKNKMRNLVYSLQSTNTCMFAGAENSIAK